MVSDYRLRIDYDKMRKYATQNNWILDEDFLVSPHHVAPEAALRLVRSIDLEQAPVFDEMNREFWKIIFAEKENKELQIHLRKLGYHPGKNRGALVSKLCIYYRKLVKA